MHRCIDPAHLSILVIVNSNA
jgi:short subunit dehydrogenase-like uncharacterized protein